VQGRSAPQGSQARRRCLVAVISACARLFRSSRIGLVSLWSSLDCEAISAWTRTARPRRRIPGAWCLAGD
jgi:hypothetical protein